MENEHGQERLEMKTPTPEAPPVDRAALTIMVQSWMTPIVGLVMLVVGMLAGYVGHSLVAAQPLARQPTAAASSTPAAAAVSATNPPTMMDSLVAQTRHFRGDPNAPVTIIEFGDFQ